MFVSYVCCVSSGLCDELITRSEESFQVCLIVCDLETATMMRSVPELGCWATEDE